MKIQKSKEKDSIAFFWQQNTRETPVGSVTAMITAAITTWLNDDHPESKAKIGDEFFGDLLTVSIEIATEIHAQDTNGGYIGFAIGKDSRTKDQRIAYNSSVINTTKKFPKSSDQYRLVSIEGHETSKKINVFFLKKFVHRNAPMEPPYFCNQFDHYYPSKNTIKRRGDLIFEHYDPKQKNDSPSLSECKKLYDTVPHPLK